MPITGKGYEYDIPEEYKAMITKSFLQTLKYELKVVFARDDSDPRWYEEEETWAYLTGTGGWNIAFHKAAKLYKLDALADYYDTLPWYDSDMFDGEIGTLALFYNVIKPIPPVTLWDRIKGHVQYQWWMFELWVKALVKRGKK